MTILDRVAAAPISCGVCEVPGWGRELPPARVLGEMRALGMAATELGPDGYLPTDPAELRKLLAIYDLTLVAGFLPAILHRPDELDQTVAAAEPVAAQLAAMGAEVLVAAAATSTSGYEARPTLDEPAWATLAAGVRRLEEVAARHGLALAVHPHLGTVVEGPAEVERLLEATDSGLCIDTGHLLAGGSDPLAVVHQAGDRVCHVHLKDVDSAVAEAWRTGRISYIEAVRAGLFRPLGRGDAPIAPVVAALEHAGYRQWYVLEQDVALPEGPGGTVAPDEIEDLTHGPGADVRTSLDYLRWVESKMQWFSRHAGQPSSDHEKG
jgi:inosose dehydratase